VKPGSSIGLFRPTTSVGIAEFAGQEIAGLENDGVEQEQTYAFKVILVLFEGIV